METREFDVVLFGATGYVGRYIAEHLRDTGGDARIALAGRNADKLAAARERLGVDWPLVVADSDDAASLGAMAERTRVVLTTVGPYSRSGLALVGACAAAGTHYVDLTGEVLFVRDSIDSFDAAAKASGATIVHACGFDSVPGDLTVLLTARAAARAGAGTLLETVLHARELKAGMSGGSLDSLRVQIDGSAAAKQAGRRASDPYALSPDRDAEPEPVGRKGRVWLETSPEVREWAAPFIMGRYNEQIVRRSNALLGFEYGRTFRYREMHDAGRGPAGAAKALGIALVPAALAGALRSPLRPVLDAVLPKPGEGPSEAAAAAGRIRIETHATAADGSRWMTTYADDRDPGYTGTAVLIGQAALALAAGEGLAAGVLTPATALGEPYADRLRAQGFRLDTTRLD